jgi:hypothetical protein
MPVIKYKIKTYISHYVVLAVNLILDCRNRMFRLFIYDAGHFRNTYTIHIAYNFLFDFVPKQILHMEKKFETNCL